MFRIFFRTPGTRPLLVLACLVVAGIAEGLSIGALLPLAASFGGGAGGSSPLSAAIGTALDWLGLGPSLGNLILFVTGFMVLKCLIAFGALSYAGISAARVAVDLRRRLIAAIFAARWSFFADQRGGQIANIMANEASRAGDAYLVSAQAIAFLMQALAYAVVALLLNWQVALLGFAASALLAAALTRLIQAAKRAGYKQTDRTSDLTTHMADVFANIKPLRAMQRQAPVLAQVSRTLGRLKRALINRELSKAGLAQAGDAMVAVIVGGGIYAAATLSSLSFAEMVVSGVVFFQVISVVTKLQRMIQQAALLESGYVRATELIADAEARREHNPGTLKPDPGQPIRFEAVSFAHAEAAVISDASFEIVPGSITVLHGPSGAGKTTLIDLLIGLNRPQSGEVHVGPEPLSRIDLQAWRGLIGYVPQELNLFHDSIRENIRLGDETIGDPAILAALARAGASDFAAALPHGLDTDVGEMGGKLSGGQRQRISLARALVREPKILILDEVTSALDPATEAGIVANIRALRGAYTIVAITHREAWSAIADRLYRVSDGAVKPVQTPLRPASAP